MTSGELIPLADVEALAKTATAKIVELVGTAESLTITTPDQYTAADKLLGVIKTAFNEAEAKRTELKAPVLTLGREIDGAFKPAKEAYDRGENVIKQAMLAFRRRQEAEAERRAAEIRQKEDERKAKLLQRAETAEEKGKDRQAETLREQAMTMPITEVTANIPKTATSYRMVKKWEVVDMKAVKPEYIITTVDTAAIDGLVSRVGERAAEIVGGIHVWETEVAVAPRTTR